MPNWMGSCGTTFLDEKEARRHAYRETRSKGGGFHTVSRIAREPPGQNDRLSNYAEAVDDDE